MIQPHRTDIFLLSIVLEVLRHVACTPMYDCPRSLYDCKSLEAGLMSTADNFFSPEFMASRHEDSYISEICKFMKTPQCSDSIIRECTGNLVYATRAFKSRIQYICGEARFPRKDHRKLETCVDDNYKYFESCSKKRKTKEKEVPYITQPGGTQHPWCNVTNDYMICIYSVMAMGCDFETAEKYMETLNNTAPVVEAILTHGCQFGHPLEILKTTSPPADTTSLGAMLAGSGYTSRWRPTSGSHRSAAVSWLSRRVSMGILLDYSAPCVLVLGIYYFHAIILNALVFQCCFSVQGRTNIGNSQR